MQHGETLHDHELRHSLGVDQEGTADGGGERHQCICRPGK